MISLCGFSVFSEPLWFNRSLESTRANDPKVAMSRSLLLPLALTLPRSLILPLPRTLDLPLPSVAVAEPESGHGDGNGRGHAFPAERATFQRVTF